jgi:amidase
MRRPTAEELVEVGRREHLRLTPVEAQEYARMLDGLFTFADDLDDIPLPPRPVRHTDRDPGGPPDPSADPLNAFIRHCRVRGAAEGPLAGWRVAVKDNIDVAGVPTTNASRAAAYVPVTDAVVVERLLDAGAEIVGKLNLDDYSTGATGESSFWGPARNPHDPRRSAGGSSGGAGAAVASGAVDLALAVDQGGSGRIPAAFCGAVSIKATHGLIPSFGVTHVDQTFDNVCPMAMTVERVARGLDVISGHDWRDAQWVRARPEPTACVDALDRGVGTLRIGIVQEAVGEDVCEPAVLDGFRRSCASLEAAGASLTTVSVPLWRSAWKVQVVLLLHLAWATIQSEGQGYGHMGAVDIDRVRSFALSRRAEADDMAPMFKVWLLAGRWLQERTLSLSLARAQNLRLAIRDELDRALQAADVLITPSVFRVAPLVSEDRVDDAQFLATRTSVPVAKLPEAGAEGTASNPGFSNSSPLNLSGHPALVLPSGRDADGLPVSVQLIGRHFDEATLFAAAAALER